MLSWGEPATRIETDTGARVSVPPAETQAKLRFPARVIGRRRWVRWVVAAMALSCGCASAPAGPTMAPLGDYETEVGVSWSLTLVALDPGAGGLRWTLLDGPQDMTLTAAADLVWLATAFDLALVRPGRPRAAGPSQRIRVRLCDRDDTCDESSGTIRAIPTR